MRQIINLLLFVAFLFCYLSWPPNNAMFIYEAEYQIVTETKNFASNFTHPIILLGFIAQLLLLHATFFKNANRKLNSVGVILLTPIVLLFLVVGLLSMNFKIAVSTLPFLMLVVVYFVHLKKTKKVI